MQMKTLNEINAIKNINRAGFIIYNEDAKKYLLVQTKVDGYAKWGPPKGRWENGESICACAIRELEEETGIVITLDNTAQYVTRVLNCCLFIMVKVSLKNIPKTHIMRPTPFAVDEINDVRWFTWDAILKTATSLTDSNFYLRKLFSVSKSKRLITQFATHPSLLHYIILSNNATSSPTVNEAVNEAVNEDDIVNDVSEFKLPHDDEVLQISSELQTGLHL